MRRCKNNLFKAVVILTVASFLKSHLVPPDNRELDDETGTSDVVGEELEDTAEEDEARASLIGCFTSLWNK